MVNPLIYLKGLYIETLTIIKYYMFRLNEELAMWCKFTRQSCI